MLSQVDYQRAQPEPSFFSLDDLRDDDEQDSPLLCLQDKLLDKIIEYVPLKDRLLRLRSVCHRMSDCVKRTVKSVEFLRDELDYCSDAKIAFFLSVYGRHVEHVNFDLFRSCSLREYTQWSWRQSVISSVTRCPQLRHLDILVCCRHRLRDSDLAVIFKQCQQLEVLRIDASFLNGHCFAQAPGSLSKVELECCQKLTKPAFLTLCSRLPRLQTLHVSLFEALDEPIIKKIGDLRALKTLSICADADRPMNTFRLAEIRRIPGIETLCLDGVNNVTDKFLADISDPASSPLPRTLRHLSIAWCKNVGPAGVARLKSLEQLVSLNLDGITKRDISTGLEVVGRENRLERLLVSEDCFVSPKTLIDVVTRCERLRTLDVSNNHRLTDKSFAEGVYSARAFTFAAPMVILTDSKSIWRRLPPYSYQNRVEIVNTQQDRHPEEYVPAISVHTAQQLPRGHLIPELRRGNRYKMLNLTAEMMASVSSSSSPPPPLMGYDEAEFERLYQQELENLSPEAAAAAATAMMSPDEMLALYAFENHRKLLDGRLPPAAHLQMADVSGLVLSDQFRAFKAMEFEDSVTVGSAGAPQPPEAGILRHSRPSRPKRQAQKEYAERRKSGRAGYPMKTSAEPKKAGPAFTDDDFPPL